MSDKKEKDIHTQPKSEEHGMEPDWKKAGYESLDEAIADGYADYKYMEHVGMEEARKERQNGWF